MSGQGRYPLGLRRRQPNAETLGYRSRIAAAGGSITPADLLAVDTFVSKCKQAGLWSKIQDMSPLAGNSLASALVKLKGSGSLTGVNIVGGDYTRTGGIDPGATNSTKHLATGWIPSANVADTSFHAAFHSISFSAAYGGSEMGAIVNGATQAFQYFARFTGDLGGYDSWTNAAGRCTTLTSTNGQGLFIGSRISGTDSKFYRNATQIATLATAEGTSPNIEVFVLAVNQIGTPVSYSPRPIGYYSLGTGMTGGEITTYTGLIQQLMSAFGRAI